MSSTSEVGHAKNVANFERIISHCIAYESTYNPSKTSLLLVNLENLLTQAQSAISTVANAKNTYDTATGERALTFDAVKPLATRICNALAVTDANDETIKDAKSINKKIQGGRSTPKKEGSISSSRQSFDVLVENFSALVDLISSVPSYNPNETELTTASLESLVQDLQAANSNVIHKKTAYSNAMIARDQVLYTENTGLIDTVADVKKYIKSIFGATSPQYKQVSGIKFVNTSKLKPFNPPVQPQ